jgi:hypothetical protein
MGVNQRQEVTEFLRVVDELVNNSDGAQESVVHAPMHDAESIFWRDVFPSGLAKGV